MNDRIIGSHNFLSINVLGQLIKFYCSFICKVLLR